MSALREIRRKLGSVKNIKKITQVMEIVAASHLRRAQAKAEMSRPYFTRLTNTLDHLMFVDEDLTHPLMTKRAVKKRAFIVIAGDRGLCGGYNQSIITSTEKLLKQHPPSEIELILVGRRVIDHFSNKSWSILEKISDWGGKITYAQIEQLTHDLLKHYLDAKFDEAWLIHTHYINISSRKVIVEKFLNMDYLKVNKEGARLNYILEPEVSEILDEILPRYCIAKMQSVLNEAYVCELAARVFSMGAATKNSEEMIEKLTRLHNKIRQAAITRELIELTAHA